MSTISENRIKILIVDKHEAVRRALSIRLSTPAELEVVGVAADPDEALRQIESTQPDVIIYGLQNGSDEDLLRTANAVRIMAKATPTVIVLAPYADSIERELLLQAGAKRYLLKHIDSVQLIYEIELASAQSPLV